MRSTIARTSSNEALPSPTTTVARKLDGRDPPAWRRDLRRRRRLGSAPGRRARAGLPRIADSQTEEQAEEGVPQRRRRERTRARDEARPGSVTPLGMDELDDADRRPQHGVLDQRRRDSRLDTAAAEAFEQLAERGAAGRVRREVREPLVAAAREE